MSVLTLSTVSSAVQTAQVVTQRTPDSLTDAAKLLYTALVLTAIETAKGRGYSPNVTHVTLHLPSEQLAKACGIHRRTVWKHLPALRSLGLIDYRTHKGSCRGETRNTGTLFQVRLDPVRGSSCRLSYDDLKHKWRDLDRDVRAGRTSYRDLQRESHTKDSTNQGIDLDRLLNWTLPPQNLGNPVKPVCDSARRVSLEALLDVTKAPKEERNSMVALAAQALAQSLADQNSVSWYQKLLWQLLRRSDATGDDYSYQVYMMATRARTDAQEGFARKPGALFTARLKQAPWWDEVRRQAAVRVGPRPMKA